MFSTDDEGVLYDLDCWEDFGAAAESAPLGTDQTNGEDDNNGDGGVDREDQKSQGEAPSGKDGDIDEGEGGEGGEGDEGLDCEEAKSRAHRRIVREREARRKEAEAVLAWLRSIESSLADKCAEVCDAAWYDLGETITYKGRPVAYSIPATVMEAATRRREHREDMDKRGRRPR